MKYLYIAKLTTPHNTGSSQISSDHSDLLGKEFRGGVIRSLIDYFPVELSSLSSKKFILQFKPKNISTLTVVRLTNENMVKLKEDTSVEYSDDVAKLMASLLRCAHFNGSPLQKRMIDQAVDDIYLFLNKENGDMLHPL